jgi:hypothetical protein
MRTSTRSATVLAVVCAALLCATHAAAADDETYYGQGQAQDNGVQQVDDDGLALKAGEFAWLPGADMSSNSPVTMLISLRDQRGYLYRDGRRIAVTTVSTGRPGHDTPTGVFPILSKEKMHHSNKYENAPMPWMQRLTEWGHALHAGNVRPTPSSHGCVRLPAEFARQLYLMTKPGDIVVIAEDPSPRSLAIAGADDPTAQLVGITEPLPHIVFIQPGQQVSTDSTAEVSAAP